MLNSQKDKCKKKIHITDFRIVKNSVQTSTTAQDESFYEIRFYQRLFLIFGAVKTLP